ncbi:hypothetical protein [Oceanobacillus rekensis]|uniref:hypothetical protein n=1 Tax=Oceanobacillus rekensis TaxID=937927 RepID=UPI000B4335A0|nr:hypothetical protein [Oceanobacillus rekensis]
MIKHWNQNHTYIAIGIVVAILLIYGITYLNLIKPLQAETKAIETEISMYEKQLQNIKNGMEEEVSDDLKNTVAKIPESKSTDTILTEMQEIAVNANVSIEYIGVSGEITVQQEGEEESSIIKENSYTLDATAADLDAIHIFLDGVKKSERLLRLDAINMEQSESDIYLTITFTAFHAG